MPDKKPSPLADALLAGLAQENADPDAGDARFAAQAAALKPEDMLMAPDPDADDEEGDE